MSFFSQIFLIMLFLSTATHLWLSIRQKRYVQQHRAQVPNAFAEKISLKEHQKAADYTLAKENFGIFSLLFSTALLLFWTLGGGLNSIDQWLRGFAWPELYTGVVLILLVGLLSSLLELPLSLYNTFVLEEKFGFNRTQFSTWLSDLLKQLLLSLLIGVPLLLLILWLMDSAGQYWWLYAWAVWMSFSFFMMWAYPAFIAPLFNDFNELEDQSLKQRIEQLMQRCGFTSKGILVMDGSRRSSHGNAYFTGLGNNKQIVFYDNLLQSLNDAEVEAVLAHELGHFKRKHILKRLLSMTVLTLAGFALLGWLMQQNWFYQGLGMETASVYAALMLFSLVSPVFTFFLSPISAFLSRKHEFEADEYAALQANAQDLISALVKLYKDNASTLTPDPIHSAYYDSHPPASVRIAHLQSVT